LGKLAYQLAEKNKLPCGFTITEQSTGLDLFKGFIIRQPELNLQQIETHVACSDSEF
jgi:hypothetical protein